MPQNPFTSLSGRSSMSRRLFLTTTGALSLGAALTACGGDSGSSPASAKPVSQADIDKAMTTPTDADLLDLGAEHRPGGGALREEVPGDQGQRRQRRARAPPQYTKLRTALKAGSGAPDLAQIEYQYIPTFTITNSLVDLRPYGATAHKAKFVDWTWGQVTGQNGEIWAYPQDTGPMGMLYRAGHLRQVRHRRCPRRGTSSPRRRASCTRPPRTSTSPTSRDNEAAAWHGLMWQAGSQAVHGHRHHRRAVASTTPRRRRSPATGAALAKEGLVSTDPDFTDAWFQRLQQRQVRDLAHRGVGPGVPRPAAPRRPPASGGPPRCRSGSAGQASRPATGAARPPRSSRAPRTRSRRPSSPSS